MAIDATDKPQQVTVGCLCYRLSELTSWHHFATKVSAIVQQAKAKKVEVLQFPELFSIELLSLIDDVDMPQLWLKIDRYSERFNQLFANLANQYQLWIVAGSQVQLVDGEYFNLCSLFGPGNIKHDYSKAHLFGGEKALGESGGKTLPVFDTPFGKMAIQLCYDIQFPEASRLLAQQGADIIFCPAYTVGEQGYWRVRHCCHARAIENTVYVVLSSTIGQTPVSTIGAGFGQAAVTCPSGNAFAHQGLLGEGKSNQESLLVITLDLDKLRQYRQGGETAPIADRRQDLYQLSSAAIPED